MKRSSISKLEIDNPVLNIIDIEASGLGHNSYPIEIGFLLNDGTAYDALIRPLPKWVYWDNIAEGITAFREAI